MKKLLFLYNVKPSTYLNCFLKWVFYSIQKLIISGEALKTAFRGGVIKDNYFLRSVFLLMIPFSFVGCENVQTQLKSQLKKVINYKPSTKIETSKKSVLIKNATVYTAAGSILNGANILVDGNKIIKISEKEIIAEDAQVVDAEGMHITPGIIDVHSHMGVYPNPRIRAHADGNEATNKSTPEVRAKESFWPQDPSLWRALAGGVTTIQVLPGSANLIGGESYVAKLDLKTTAEEMRFKAAPRGIKMACGENPKRVYGEKSGPSTRMGNAAAFRELFQKAKEYKPENVGITEKDKKKDVKTDYALETLKAVLKGDVLVHIHCYRADDIANMIALADEFKFKISAFHHGLEAYKVKKILAKKNIYTATWSDWWGFKAEAYDGIPHNIALLQQAGANPIVHSDSEIDVTFLNVEAAKARRAGLELGIKVSVDEALKWITKNPAEALGVGHLIGTLEEGKLADMVLWDGHPLSAYSKAQKVMIEGKWVLDRAKGMRPISDFELGYREQSFYNHEATRKQNRLPDLGEIKFYQKPVKENSFAIKNVRLNLEPIFYDVLIREGEIQEVSLTGAYKNWGDVALVEGQEKILTSGLIESASNLGLLDIELENSANDAFLVGQEPSFIDLQAQDAIDFLNVRIPISRTEGVLTNISYIYTPNLLKGIGVGFDLFSKVDTEVLEVKPLISYIGHTHSKESFSKAKLWRDLRRVVFETNKFSKGQYNEIQKPFLTELDYQKLMPYVRGEQPWVFAISKAQDIHSLIEYKKELLDKYGFNIKPIILGGHESWLVVDKLVAHKIPVVLKPSHLVPASFDQVRVREDLAKYLIENKVTVALTSGNSHESSVRRLRQEMAFAIKHGLKWEEALKTVTSNPADIYNIKNRGSVREGYLANLVLWSGDPADINQRAERIWIQGEEQSLSNRQRLLAEKYLN